MLFISAVMLPENIALIQDWLIGWGGAEQVLLEMAALYPHAPIYTSLLQPQALPEAFKNLNIHTTFLQRWPGAYRYHRLLLPLMPLAFESLDLQGFDLILSSSHACAKGIIPAPHSCHLSYIHTPLRYAWDMLHVYFEQERPWWLKRVLMHWLLHYLRQWDVLSNLRVDAFACNSTYVKQRIWRYYRREAQVIHPPVHMPTSPPQRTEADYYLVVSRLVSYKRLDLAVAAFNENGRRLMVIGEGPELPALQALAGPRIKFLGAVSRSQLEDCYRSARALIFPGLEDFGLVPVEAQAFGCPVIAFGRGGVCDSVIPGKTGIFFQEQTIQSLNYAIQCFESQEFSSQELFAHAQQFSPVVFREKFKTFVCEQWEHFQHRTKSRLRNG